MSESSEHCTPTTIVDRVVAFLGVIDLDPCSNSHEHPNVPALHHFTQADDGLAQTWSGRVYMNPPYGRSITAWVAKLKAEYLSGHVSEAIALVPARTDTRWFRLFRDFPCCLVTGRIVFVGNEASAPFPSAIFYLGPRRGAFIEHFSTLGDVWQRARGG